MVKKVKVIILLMAMSVGVFYNSIYCCASTAKKSGNNKLNDRQVAILEELKMPTDWDELDGEQRYCITSIEDMLVYLEDKYGKEFCFGAYQAADEDSNTKEELLAYAKGDSRKTDCFRVRPITSGYYDDYPKVYLWPKYCEKYNKQIKKIVGDKVFLCYPVIGTNDGKKAYHTSVRIILSYSKNYRKLGKKIYKKLISNDEVDQVELVVEERNFIEGRDFSNWDYLFDDNVRIDGFCCDKYDENFREIKWEKDQDVL
ncbi:MAG: hypothetical protein K6D38_02630 [Pseudobutyrivibrio sp.]|nr:hypothetical protein [Pseudobutyrivibrio sp.]